MKLNYNFSKGKVYVNLYVIKYKWLLFNRLTAIYVIPEGLEPPTFRTGI